MFFIVSTGRSGTTTIAELLRRSPDCVCPHEPEPRLVAEASQYAYGEYPHQAMVDLLRQSRPVTVDGKQYGESANKLATVIPALKEAFPQAKYVWLIRDGRPVAESFFARNAYHPLDESSLWGVFRLRGDKTGDVPARTWAAYSRFEKCCWRFSYVNRLAEKHLREYGCEYLFIKLEELEARQAELFEFLNLTPPPEDDRSVQRLNVGPAHNLRQWRDWNAEERAAFIEICGAEMDRWYPDWRADSPELWTAPSLAVRSRIQVKRFLRSIIQPPISYYTAEHRLKKATRALPRRLGRMLRAIS